jgi:type IV secretory pathway VirB10-like protein
MQQPCPTPLPWFTAASVLLVGAVLLFSSPLAQAQWKWKDKNGQVHVSDLPPPRDVADKDVLQRPTATTRTIVVAPSAAASAAPAAAAPVAPPKAALDTELDKRRKAAEAEKTAQANAEEEKLAGQRRENCARAKSHAAALESGLRMARTNEKGEREILDDKARADEMRRTREIIAADCR